MESRSEWRRRMLSFNLWRKGGWQNLLDELCFLRFPWRWIVEDTFNWRGWFVDIRGPE